VNIRPDKIHIEGWTVTDACRRSPGGMVLNPVNIHVLDVAVIPEPAVHPAVALIHLQILGEPMVWMSLSRYAFLLLKMPNVRKRIVLSKFPNVRNDFSHPNIHILSRKLLRQSQLFTCFVSIQLQLS
jgi:hypothetical protein